MSFFLVIALNQMALPQEIVYTLNRFTPFYNNPAATSMDYEASISFFHDEYTIGTGDFITSDVFSAKYPIIKQETGRRLAGIGVNFSERDFGQSDLLKNVNAGISLSTSIQLTGNQSLGFGIATNYYSKRTSIESLTTASQWIASEFRFDPDANLGEAFTRQNVEYLSLGTGLLWQYHRFDTRKLFAGFSAFHLNRPNENFFQKETNVPIGLIANAGAVLYQRNAYSLAPELYYTRSRQTETYRLLVANKFSFSNTNPYDLIASGSFDIQLNYSFRKDAALGVVFNQPGFSIGFAYQFPFGKADSYLKNGIQIGISLNRLLWRHEPQRVVVTEPAPRRQLNFESQSTTRQETEVETIQRKLEELDEVKSLQFELSKDFKFEFGKAGLSPASDAFLREISEMLNQNPTYKLQIVGHTDNVGKQQANYDLSLKRAQVVAESLIKNGVSSAVISTLGVGDTRPLVPNDTDENKAKNRRVEFIIQVDH